MKSKLLLALGLMVGGLSSQVLAGNLPYEGAAENCKEIKTPEYDRYPDGYRASDNSVDAGFMTTQDCKTIFVLPPKRGKAYLSSYNITGGADLCDSYVNDKDTFIRLKKKENEVLLQLADNFTDELDKKAERILKYVNRKTTTMAEYDGTVGLVGNMYFEHEWESLIAEYKHLNPDKEVKKIPVIGSVFHIETKKRDSMSLDLDRAWDGIYSLDIPGVHVGNYQTLADRIGYQADLSTGAFSFGNSLSGTVKLNFHGMCHMRDALKKRTAFQTLDDLNDSAQARGVNAYMAANLYVWYPVELHKKYEIKIDIKQTSKVVHNFLKRKNTFQMEEFINSIDSAGQDNTIKISIEDEDSSANDQDLLDEVRLIKEKILDDILGRILANLATPIGPRELVKLDLPSDPHVMQTRWATHCHTSRRWFKKRTHCYRQPYQVKVKVQGEALAKVETEVKRAVKYFEDGKASRTVLRDTSLAFTRKLED